MNLRTPLLTAASLLVLFEVGPVVGAQAGPTAPTGGQTGAPTGVTPGPAGPTQPGYGGPTSPGGFPLLPGAPGTPTGWPFEPGLLGPDTVTPGGVGTSELFSPAWVRWWRANESAFLALRAHVHRPPYREGDVIGFEADASLAARRAPFFPTPDVVRTRVLPALMQMLETERASDVERALLLALARASRALPVSERALVVDLLAARLETKDQATLETGLVALSWTAHPRAARLLAHVLNEDATAREYLRGDDVPLRARVQSALGLGRIAAEQHRDLRRFVVGVLSKVVAEPEGGVPDVRVAALLAWSLAPLPWSDDVAAPEQAGTYQHGADRLTLLFLDRDEHDSVRAQALETWSRWIASLDPHRRRTEKERFLPLILGRMRPDLHDSILSAAVVALGNLVDEDDDPLDRRAVERLLDLADVSAPRWVEARRWMELARIVTRGGDAASSGTSRANVQTALLETLVRGNADERVWSVLALGRIGHGLTLRGEDIGDPIRGALRVRLSSGPTADEEAALCLVLGWLRDLGSQKLLEERFFRAAQLRVRAFAALGLGLLGERSSLPLLTAVQAARTLPDVDLEAAVTLARALLDDRDIALVRLNELERSVALEAKLAQLRAIGEVGDVRAVSPLLALATSSQEPASLRSAAILAAGRVAEPDLRTGAWRYVQDTSDAAWTAELLVALRGR